MRVLGVLKLDADMLDVLLSFYLKLIQSVPNELKSLAQSFNLMMV